MYTPYMHIYNYVHIPLLINYQGMKRQIQLVYIHVYFAEFYFSYFKTPILVCSPHVSLEPCAHLHGTPGLWVVSVW